MDLATMHSMYLDSLSGAREEGFDRSTEDEEESETGEAVIK